MCTSDFQQMHGSDNIWRHDKTYKWATFPSSSNDLVDQPLYILYCFLMYMGFFDGFIWAYSVNTNVWFVVVYYV